MQGSLPTIPVSFSIVDAHCCTSAALHCDVVHSPAHQAVLSFLVVHESGWFASAVLDSASVCGKTANRGTLPCSGDVSKVCLRLAEPSRHRTTS